MNLEKLQTPFIIIALFLLIGLGFLVIKGVSEAILSNSSVAQQPETINLNLEVLKSDKIDNLLGFNHIDPAPEEDFGRDNLFNYGERIIEEEPEETTTTTENSTSTPSE